MLFTFTEEAIMVEQFNLFLGNENKIVMSSRKLFPQIIKVEYTYPLSKRVVFQERLETGTVDELLYAIRSRFSAIYKEEKDTSSARPGFKGVSGKYGIMENIKLNQLILAKIEYIKHKNICRLVVNTSI